MNEVSAWLAENEAGIPTFWVGARDMAGDNSIKWMANDEIVDDSFFIFGAPDHNGGDCVFLLVASGELGTVDCDPHTHMNKHSLCRLYGQ